MNTNDLIRMASNLFGFSSDKTKDIAEWLYDNGYITFIIYLTNIYLHS